MDQFNETIKATLQEKVKQKDTAEPTVINDDIIRQYMVQYKEENKIFDKKDTPFESFSHLALSFKSQLLDIIEINNLNCLEKLSKLQLDNNIIHKIQNLDHLINLKWLDLSFNLINKIEGLDKLVKLQDLSLFSNNITEVENLDKLVNLNILSIGNNKIDTPDTMAMYLRRFPKLQVLNVKGNKFCKDNGNEYKLLILAYLKNLKYLDYTAVDKNMLLRAEDRYRDDINDKQAKAAEAKGEEPVDPMSKQQREQFRSAHITTVIDFFRAINENDDEMAKIRKFPKYSQIFSKYDQEVRDRTKTFTDDMVKINEKRVDLMKFCTKKLRQIEKQSEGGSITIIDNFKREKKNALKQLDEEEYDQDIYNKIKQKLNKLEDDLLSKEMKLVEALSEAAGQFKQGLDTITDDMRKMTETFVEDVLRVNQQYHDELEKYSKLLQIEITKQIEADPDNNNIDEDEQDSNWKIFVLEDQALSQTLETTKDSQHSKISDKETQITSALVAEKEKYMKNIQQQQHKRNRNTVTEIIALITELSGQIEREMSERMSEDNYE